MAATRSVKTAARAKRPKAEIQKEFEELQEEVAAARETADPKAAETALLRESEIRQAVDGITVESVVQKMSGLTLEVSKAVSGLSEQLLREVERLANLREAAELERRELERLHKIDIAATSLDHLVQEYARQREALVAEAAMQRATWEEEVRVTERERKEQEEALKKQRQREIDDYEYKKALERKKAQDKYDEEVRLLEKQNREKQETLEKSWKLREAVLKESEEELARLKKEAETFPVRLQKESEQAAARATQAAEARFEQQNLMLKKDAESEARLAELRIKNLEDALGRQSAQLEALEKQLAEAKKQVQDIAVKAIEGASGAKTLSHINQIAMEQAKNRPQG